MCIVMVMGVDCGIYVEVKEGEDFELLSVVKLFKVVVE